tara:strand:- start:519 stop:794 length:276 start_codon:yes stop_codon:yes gene_type:complete
MEPMHGKMGLPGIFLLQDEARRKKQKRKEVVHAHRTEVIAIPFSAAFSALPAAPAFACSVASLCRFAGYHAPGLLGLRRGALAHRRLARDS